ncbi:hypothetical protein PTSG_12803 [Salpingoeca rosetta]|uniref:Armadillo repeat-containing protein 4 n=1 Tax=Salpingoeca rosetta (strain ATCC 50818 / BSB-021) TaxID=946362 RepID=F2UKU7_SALR5|nr:uncharacterized protein PTSG_12803 [Salpingoeca rosetta]EGD77746.1 hypothetical protein PTSG_12803 [Salpingoeca rosetta]|eukprot:XP_004990222.1 hypothetical protein PTSG_12803 [Salpingoeca rosetta]
MGVRISRLNTEDDDAVEQLITDLSALVATHPIEAEMAFEKPLEWTTSITPEDLSGMTHEADEDRVLLDLTQDHIIVGSLQKLQHVLTMAGSKKVDELKALMKENEDPLANILGAAYGGGAKLSSIHASLDDSLKAQNGELVTALDKYELDGADDMSPVTSSNAQQQQQQQEDDSQEARSVKAMQRAEAEMSRLRNVAGVDDDDLLEELDWETSITFSNGLRVPPWKQADGSLGHILANPKDGDRFYVMAHVDGFWEIKGPDHATGDMNTEQVGSAYNSLMELLRAKSPIFEEGVDKASFAPKLAFLAEEDERAQSGRMGGRGQDSSRRAYRPSRIWLTEEDEDSVFDQSKETLEKAMLVPCERWSSFGLQLDTPTSPSPNKSSTLRLMRSGLINSRRMSQTSSAWLPIHSLQTPTAAEDFSESDESDEEEDIEERRMRQADLPPEYWSIQKLVRYLSGGNVTATVIALSSLRDHDLTSEIAQFAIRDVGGLELLINLLDTEEDKCKIGALQVLKDISLHPQVKKAIAEMNGMRPLVAILESPNDQLKCLAAITISHCANFPRNRRMFRYYGGITKAVELLRIGAEDPSKLEVARCGALALWSSSSSSKNKEHILKAGAVPLLAELLTKDDIELLVPVVGVLEECATSQAYRDLIRKYNLTPFLVANLSKDNKVLQAHSAMAIFKCAEDPATRRIVRECGGLEPLVRLLNPAADTLLLEGVTGAIWKTAYDADNIAEYSRLKAVEQLVALLRSSSEAVLMNVAGALGQLATNTDSCRLVRTAGGVEPLINLLTGTNAELLINVTKAVGRTAQLKDNIDAIDKLDGVRLLWSLLKHSNAEVQASAAWAICPCIKNARDAGELVRSFVGGLELVVGLLKSSNQDVLAGVCALIAQIAKDEENLAVITDHGVVTMLSKLVRTTNDTLREHLAEAIANCCTWGNNCVAFGTEGAVAPLARYLKSKSSAVRHATAHALHQLSRDPENCVTMHQAGVVRPLLDLVGATDRSVQDAAARCLGNIRRLALCNEMNRYG